MQIRGASSQLHYSLVSQWEVVPLGWDTRNHWVPTGVAIGNAVSGDNGIRGTFSLNGSMASPTKDILKKANSLGRLYWCYLTLQMSAVPRYCG